MKIDRARIGSDETYKNKLRLKAQTELIWLARLLGYSKIIERVHGPVAEMCVQKNPALSIEQQSNIKERLHLDPRGTFKTTLSIVDSVQWIICFPNIRICKLTATKPLAAAIVGEITDHFELAKGQEPSDFQLLFPEFCIPPSARMVGKYTAPCRTRNWREATVMAFSIETSQSGWHFDVLDPDDPVDAENSSTKQGIAKVKKNYHINKKTLMPWGYKNHKGTRYKASDLWGSLMENARPGKIKLLVRAALKKVDGTRLEPGDFPAEQEVVLLFPELLSYEFLKNEFEEDYESFMTQYMNDAHGGQALTFTPEMMLAAVLEQETTPLAGHSFMAWRLACKNKPDMRAAGGAVGRMEGGRMFIVDAASGQFTPSRLAHKIVTMAKAHGLHQVSIEETPGARVYMDPAISNYAASMNWPLSIGWTEFEEDDGARDLRIKSTEPLVATKRLLFSDAIPGLKKLHQQFVHYGDMEDSELPDAVSRVAMNLPRSIVNEEVSAEQDLQWEMIKQKDMFDRTHGLGRYAAPEPVMAEETPYEPPKNEYGLEDEMMPGING